ncbi:hypothetical protein FEZ63_15365 [Microvirga brassicacearum]|uniref:Uncharacterized protein n=1 Tax=Microvirga brassicacearum TaxID=2580413 RepID=A0A5N3P8S8_9HYPH|nr:hypothetical protein FEZ63_15365 [Microvirga brassicacearum]
MSDWVSFDRWSECPRLERPGFVFEVSNEAGQSLFTGCTVPLQLPLDWTSPPVRFRLVAAPAPRHSAPMPTPSDRR